MHVSSPIPLSGVSGEFESGGGVIGSWKSGVDGVLETGNGEISTRLGGTRIKAEMEDDRSTVMDNPQRLKNVRE